MIDSRPAFIQGIFAFTGGGYDAPVTLTSYTVPADKRAQLIYIRAGNSTAELICLSMLRDGAMMRLFPVGAKAADHVSLAVVEDIHPDTRLEVAVAAPAGVSGVVILDVGLVEI